MRNHRNKKTDTSARSVGNSYSHGVQKQYCKVKNNINIWHGFWQVIWPNQWMLTSASYCLGKISQIQTCLFETAFEFLWLCGVSCRMLRLSNIIIDQKTHTQIGCGAAEDAIVNWVHLEQYFLQDTMARMNQRIDFAFGLHAVRTLRDRVYSRQLKLAIPFAHNPSTWPSKIMQPLANWQLNFYSRPFRNRDRPPSRWNDHLPHFAWHHFHEQDWIVAAEGNMMWNLCEGVYIHCYRNVHVSACAFLRLWHPYPFRTVVSLYWLGGAEERKGGKQTCKLQTYHCF